jgi:hypothetical protein
MNVRLLVAYSQLSSVISTTAEYVASFGRFSRCSVRYLNVINGVLGRCDLNSFDAIFHSYCARFAIPGYISDSYLEALRNFRGIKILAVQDEYDRTNLIREAIKEFQFDIVLTCVPQRYVEQIYPRKSFPKTEFVTVLTGYVPERLAEQSCPRIPLKDRPILVGYRGRDIGARYGRLAFEKYEIGRRMREICVERGVPHDIETSEQKRLKGDEWYDFVESCRSMLGSESGSNVFDDDGSLQKRFDDLTRRKGERPSYDAFRAFTESQENFIDMGQISPRVFEAAALRTPLILFSGKYSEILRPGIHYIELKKDFSNVDFVLSQLADLDQLERMADRTYNHLVRSGEFSYKRFVGAIDELIGMRLMGVTAANSIHRSSLQVPGGNSANFSRAPGHPLDEGYAELAREYQKLASRLGRPLSLAKLMAVALLPHNLILALRRRLRAIMPAQ